jgi:SAM-dependent methyltransferase
MAASQPAFRENSYGIVKRLRIIRAWLNRIPSSRSLRILDYGCGTGDYVTGPLAHDGHDLLGIDVHGESIRVARDRHRLPNLAFRQATVSDLIRDRLQFDAIICSEVLEHLDDPQGFLVSLKSLMAPEALLLITTPNGYGSYELLCRLERLMKRTGIHQMFQALLGKGPRPGNDSERAGFLNSDSIHIQFFGLRRLENIFSDSGLRILDRRGRTLLCGPYVDLLFDAIPLNALLTVNAQAADMLPVICSADWMFLLQRKSP